MTILPLLSFSQSGYPKVMVINGDTLVAITKNQQRKINLVKIERDYYRQYADSLEIGAHLLDVALVDCKELNNHFKTEIEAMKRLSHEQKRFIRELRADYKELGIENERLKKITGLLLGYSIGVTILLIILLL